MSTIYVTINHQIVMSNKKNGRNDPPFEVRNAKNDTSPITMSNGSFSGTITLQYDQNNPVAGNHVCWLEIVES